MNLPLENLSELEYAPTIAGSYLLGDINENGMIDANDMQISLITILKLIGTQKLR